MADKMTLPQLRTELKKRGLSSVGTKEVLSKRLSEALEDNVVANEDLNASAVDEPEEEKISPKATGSGKGQLRRRKSSSGGASGSLAAIAAETTTKTTSGSSTSPAKAQAPAALPAHVVEQKAEDTPPITITIWDVLPMITFFIGLIFTLLIVPTSDPNVEAFKKLFGFQFRAASMDSSN